MVVPKGGGEERTGFYCLVGTESALQDEVMEGNGGDSGATL